MDDVATWVMAHQGPLPHPQGQAAGGPMGLRFVGLPSARPRLRYQMQDGVLRAMVVEGSIEEAVGGAEQQHTPIPTEGVPIHDVTDIGPRSDAELPSVEGLAAMERLQRGEPAVFASTELALQVRGLLEATTIEGQLVLLPSLGEMARHIVVTQDNRLLVLTEVADQPRGRSIGPAGVDEIAAALWSTPREVTDSRITVYQEPQVRVHYADGGWEVAADHPEQRLALSLPLDFPAERFTDA